MSEREKWSDREYGIVGEWFVTGFVAGCVTGAIVTIILAHAF